MRTTIEISDKLLDEAMNLTKISKKTEVVRFALENIIQREKIKGLKDYFGKLDLSIDLDVLRDRKIDESC